MDRFSLINISTYQFLISIFVYIHCMFIKRISEVVSVRVIQRLRCSTLSNEFLISRELISKYRKYDSMRILMSTCTQKSIRHRLLATCWTTIMRKSSCDLKTNKTSRRNAPTEGEHLLNSQKCGSEFLGVCLAGVSGDPLRSRLATFYFRTRRISPQCGPDSSPTAR